MVKYLIDTDILASHFKGKEFATEFIKKAGGIERVAISVVTLAELLEGVVDSENEFTETEEVLSKTKVLSVDRNTALEFAKRRSQLRKKGALIDNMDLLIASTALVHKLILVTKNKKHFERIKGLKVLD